jgi:hypothetical protein
MNTQKFEHSQLFAGEVDHIVRVPVSAATIAKGDILVGTVTSGVVATAFKKETADAKVGNIYVVAAEDVKDYTGDVVAYAGGCFDSAQVRINGAEINDASKLALMASHIYVLTTN